VLRVGDAMVRELADARFGPITHPPSGAHCARSARDDSGHESARKQATVIAGTAAGMTTRPRSFPLGRSQDLLLALTWADAPAAVAPAGHGVPSVHDMHPLSDTYR
jgi:hypothetical protein